MKILSRDGHHLRLWFPDLKSLLNFRKEYLESVTNVKTNYEKHLLNQENGYIFVIDLIENE